MNGKHGDDPLLDIIEHKIEVFGKEGDEVIKQISRYKHADRVTLDL